MLLLLILVFAPVKWIAAQNGSEFSKPNNIKVNLGSLLVKNFSFQYERWLGKKTSIAIGLRFQPFGKIPFQSWLKEQVNDPDIEIGNTRIGNFALTPEFRYYFGKEAFRGLYIAPYARYASYKMEAPVRYTGSGQDRTAFFRGDIYSFSAGFLLGSQYKLGEHLMLDWYIIGAHAGGSDGQLKFEAVLSPAEQANLRSTLDESDIPFFQISHFIDGNGGTVSTRGWWAGIRGFTVNLGWRF